MAQRKKLPAAFYHSTDVVRLAKALIGKFLVSRIDGHLTSGIIVETEAYRAPEDRASHAFNHRRTPRNEVMYHPGGTAYIYICYGMHHLINVVTGPAETAHAILIRALEPNDGIEVMAMRRSMEAGDKRLAKGPGALSVALGLTKELNGVSLFKRNTPLWIEDRGLLIKPNAICAGPRIGVESAGDAALLAWRFFVKNNPYVSAHRKCF
jgi:DNA-3-methyladenine glycosylase